MEDFNLILANLLISISKKNRSEFYKILEKLKLSNVEEHEDVISKLYALYKKNIMRKDLIMFSLLLNEDKSLFEGLQDYDKGKVILNLEQSTAIFDYVETKKRHWFLDIIEHDYPNLSHTFNHENSMGINCIKLIYISNQQPIDIEGIKHVFNKIDVMSYNDELAVLYLNEMRHVLQMIEHVMKHTKGNCDIGELYYFVWNNSILSVLSKYTNLSESNSWNDIVEMINEEESLLEEYYKLRKDDGGYSQYEIFLSFCILFNMIKCLVLHHSSKDSSEASRCNITEIIRSTKQMILHIKSDKLLIEVLEDVFVLIFIKESNQTKFYNGINKLLLIIHFLRSLTNEIAMLKRIQKENPFFKRYQSLCNYITDALWRLELITNINNSAEDKNKIDSDVLHHMLAPPESLICFCLENDNFAKANEVIQIFNLDDTALVKEIRYTEKLLELKERLRKTFKSKHHQLEESSFDDCGDTIATHFQSHRSINDEFDRIVERNPHLSAYRSDRDPAMNVFDMAMTLGMCYTESKQLMAAYFQFDDSQPHDECVSYHAFAHKLNRLLSKEDNRCAADVLLETCLDEKKEKEERELYERLADNYASFVLQSTRSDCDGTSNETKEQHHQHPSHRTFIKLQEVCHSLTKLKTVDASREPFKYLQRLYYYLKEFTKMSSLDSTSDGDSLLIGVTYFDLLKTNRHKLVGKLLFERNVLPVELEPFFAKMKLDLCYHIAANCFPLVSLDDTTKSIDIYSFSSHKPTPGILSYVRKHNWLLGFIINEIYAVERSDIDANESRLRYISNYVRLSTIQRLKVLYADNEYVAAMHYYGIDVGTIEKHFEETIKSYGDDDDNFRNLADLSTESCEEASEGYVKTINWKELYDLVDGVPQRCDGMQNVVLQNLRDVVLCNLVAERCESEYYTYVRYIGDDELRLNVILKDLIHWPGDFCVDIIESELTRFNTRMPEKHAVALNDWKVKIRLYEELRSVFMHKSWHDIEELCNNGPSKVLTNILQTHDIDLLMLFMQIHNVDDHLHRIDLDYFMSLFDVNVPLSKISKLFDKLPPDQTIDICQNLIKLLREFDYLQFVTEVLLRTSTDDVHVAEWTNIKISLKILSQVPQYDRDHLWSLIDSPLSIVEMFLMNGKLDRLGRIIDYVRPDLLIDCEYVDDDENVASTEKLDELLRRYAEKSLDFRVITQPNPNHGIVTDNKLMQSFDSLITAGKNEFVMPDCVPLKSEWTENNEVIECMCCHETRFSMFNRRHHCRRCGRVVCWSCSTKRMLVPTYEDILVRVCIDCYEQTHGDGTTSRSGDTIASSSFCDGWILTDDPEHNAIIRDEFSYEHAPNISLCLAILKNHSKNDEYPKFLLNQCDDMLKLIQPLSVDPSREIDYMLVIKMMRTLAMAAKMSCSNSMSQWGVTLAERILTQADLLALLVERGCLNLLPPRKGHPYVDSAVLRRLRDKLLEKEEWNLALEVSTKAGLDNTSVFAAWGKSCLRAGSLIAAREKFRRCFERILHKTSEYFMSSDSDGSSCRDGANSTRHLRLSSSSDAKPIRTPPLLREIVQILEANVVPIDRELLKESKNNKLQFVTHKNRGQNDVPICILNKLKNLNAISSGNYYRIEEEANAPTRTPFIESIVYNECIFYLQMYGTHFSLLEFYVKHEAFHDALLYIIENHLPTDIFVEVYMVCLKTGVINKLQENMSGIDSTLNLWKDYLKSICKYLEKQCLLHSLYQLQQFMCDYVRASLTCIKFYTENATTFQELLTRVKYLYKSQEHLRQEIDQDQWVEVTAIAKVDNSEDAFEQKTVVNPSLVLKMDGKSIEKCIEILNVQIEVVKFLAQCEKAKPIMHYISKINVYSAAEKSETETQLSIPTVIYRYDERVQLAVLSIVAGQKVTDGFNLASKIIDEFKLKPVKVYCQAGKILAEENRYSDLAQLVGCIRNADDRDNAVRYECDEMLLLAVRTISRHAFDPHQIDELVKFITDKGTKINAYIECKQLKSAYVLALKFNRVVDIRRIMHEAELLNKPDVIKLCKRTLQAHAASSVPSSGSKNGIGGTKK